MSGLLADLRFAYRTFKRTKLPFVLVIGLLGISVGSTIAVLGAIDALVVNPLAIQDPGRVVHLLGLATQTPGSSVSWWKQAKALDSLALFRVGEANIEGPGGKRRAQICAVSEQFFDVFRASMYLGRGFGRDHETGGQNSGVVLSYEFWRVYFNAQYTALGDTLRLNGTPYRVIGVSPKLFEFPPGTQVWLPSGPEDTVGATAFLPVQKLLPLGMQSGWVGRLRSGIQAAQAQSELAALLRRLNELTPKTGIRYGERVSVRPLGELLARNAKPALRALLMGAFLILLLAGSNCSMFLLGQAVARRREMAVRQALGASRGRIVRQVLVEAAAVGLAGGILGFFFATWSLIIIQKLLPAYLAHPLQRLSPSIPVLGCVVVLCVLLSLFTAAAPALQCGSPASLEALKDFSGPVTSSRGHFLRRLMIVAEISVALVLVVCANLSIKSFVNLREVNLGFDPERVFMVHMVLAPSGSTQDQFLARQRDAMGALRAEHGVALVAAAEALPTQAAESGIWVRHANVHEFCSSTLVTTSYFRALGIPLIVGRPFSDTDQDAVIISRKAAAELWEGANALGGELWLDGEQRPREVIGVTGDTAPPGLNEALPPQIYLSYGQPYREKIPGASMYLLARCGPVPLSCASSLSSWAAKTHGVHRFADLAGIVEAAVAPSRTQAALLLFYAALGLALAWFGVYALVSYLSVVRHHEMGVRMALGAQAIDVVFTLSGEGLWFAALGVLIGVIASFAAVRVLAGLVFGVKPMDPESFALAAFLLFSGAVLACLVPALRVALREPRELLQSE